MKVLIRKKNQCKQEKRSIKQPSNVTYSTTSQQPNRYVIPNNSHKPSSSSSQQNIPSIDFSIPQIQELSLPGISCLTRRHSFNNQMDYSIPEVRLSEIFHSLPVHQNYTQEEKLKIQLPDVRFHVTSLLDDCEEVVLFHSRNTPQVLNSKYDPVEDLTARRGSIEWILNRE